MGRAERGKYTNNKSRTYSIRCIAITSASFRQEYGEKYGMIYASPTSSPVGSLTAESWIAQLW